MDVRLLAIALLYAISTYVLMLWLNYGHFLFGVEVLELAVVKIGVRRLRFALVRLGPALTRLGLEAGLHNLAELFVS